LFGLFSFYGKTLQLAAFYKRPFCALARASSSIALSGILARNKYRGLLALSPLGSLRNGPGVLEKHTKHPIT
jgi:hypothetical protein